MTTRICVKQWALATVDVEAWCRDPWVLGRGRRAWMLLADCAEYTWNLDFAQPLRRAPRLHALNFRSGTVSDYTFTCGLHLHDERNRC